MVHYFLHFLFYLQYMGPYKYIVSREVATWLFDLRAINLTLVFSNFFSKAFPESPVRYYNLEKGAISHCNFCFELGLQFQF